MYCHSLALEQWQDKEEICLMLWITSIHYEIMTWQTPSLILLLQTSMRAGLNCCFIYAAGTDLGKKQTTQII